MTDKMTVKSITLRRDGKGPLKFSGERIGDATRRLSVEQDKDDSPKSYQVSARLFRTPSGKFVVGVEVYNQTDEEYDTREGWTSAALEDLANQMVEGSNWVNHDLLAELFEDTAIAERFVEQVD